jgi:hypothetical protein
MSETLEFKYQEAKDFPASALVCSFEDWLKLNDKIQNVIKSLKELPRLVLEDERNNPAWSETDLWGIERDIVPTIYLRCLQIIADLKDNSPISPKTP